MKPEAVLAIHISNRYLNLAPLVQSLAEYFQLDHATIRNSRDESSGSFSSTWMLLSKDQAFFQLPEIQKNTNAPSGNQPPVQIWTDDFSNLLPLLKMEVLTKIR
jgi:hypothetical protein